MEKTNTHTQTLDALAEKQVAYESALASEKEQKKSRTLGLKLVDTLIYPVINNFSVFAISVVFTYLSNNEYKPAGAVGRILKARGDEFMKVAKKFGMNESSADMAKMVTFSFVDGSLMAPVVKLVEDRREGLAKWLDERFGTKPEDESVYAAEPKQSWKSVFLGRLAVSAIVVPTAVALDKAPAPKWLLGEERLKALSELVEVGKENKKFANLNDMMFSGPGIKLGEKFVDRFPKTVQSWSDIDFRYLFKTTTFEAFYTSVCTAGLYFTSRAIARWSGDTHEQDKEDALRQKPASLPPIKDGLPSNAHHHYKDVAVQRHDGLVKGLPKDLSVPTPQI